MKKLLLLFVGLAIFGCKPEFDSNTEWKAIDVVYCVLNPDAPTQYVLVNRAFQNKDANANDLAKMNDSIYHVDSVSVRIDNLDDDNDPVYFSKTTKVRENGVFASPDHIVYELESNLFEVKDNTNYKIEVINTKTGKISYSTIKTLGEIIISKPSGSDYATLNFVNTKGEFKDPEVEIVYQEKNSLIYNISLNIVYFEYAKNNPTDTIYDTLKYTINSKVIHEASINNLKKLTLSGKSCLEYIGKNIDPIDTDLFERKFFLSYLDVTGYGEDMIEYTQAEDNFSTLSQTKPFYTNVLDAETDEEQAGLCTVKKSISKDAVFTITTTDYIKDNFPNLGF